MKEFDFEATKREVDLELLKENLASLIELQRYFYEREQELAK